MISFRPRTTYRFAAVASRHLQLSAGTYGQLRLTAEENKFLNMLKIAPRKNQDRGSVPVDPGTLWSCLRTWDWYPTDNPRLKPWTRFYCILQTCTFLFHFDCTSVVVLAVGHMMVALTVISCLLLLFLWYVASASLPPVSVVIHITRCFLLHNL